MSLPYDYYPAVLHAINLISQGETISAACDKSNLAVSTFRSYIDKDEQLHTMFAEAETRGTDAMAEALINIDNHRIHGQSNPQMAKVVSDNIKWFLSKKRPDQFGDRVKVDHSVTVDVAITTALDAARRRLPAPSDDVIDTTAIPVFEEYEGEDAEIMRELMS